MMVDSDRDLAVLVVPGLREAPLPIADGKEGETGAVFGHPGGQEQVLVSPAAIRQQIVAVGRDLYDRHGAVLYRYALMILANPAAAADGRDRLPSGRRRRGGHGPASH